MNKYHIQYLDGGMMYELKKKFTNDDANAILDNKSYIINIYKEYINLGCDYITTCNFQYNPLKMNNWKTLIDHTYGLFVKLRNQEINNNNYKILCSLPPYFETFNNGLIDKDYINYYKYIIKVMDPITDIFIIEKAVSPIHIETILDLIRKHTIKKTIVSIYVNGFIKKNDIQKIINNYEIYGLLLNCCSFEKMYDYFSTTINKLTINEKIYLGFYCNMINEIKYNLLNSYKKTDDYNILEFKNDKKITMDNLELFFKNYNRRNRLIIGGCCGYGVKEMGLLINYLRYFNYRF